MLQVKFMYITMSLSRFLRFPEKGGSSVSKLMFRKKEAKSVFCKSVTTWENGNQELRNLLSVTAASEPVLDSAYYQEDDIYSSDELDVCSFSSLAGLAADRSRALRSMSPYTVPDISILVATEPTTNYQLPLAVKCGWPLRSEAEARNCNPQEDIWVVQEECLNPEKPHHIRLPPLQWTPPTTCQTVLETDLFHTVLEIIDLAAKNTVVSEKNSIMNNTEENGVMKDMRTLVHKNLKDTCEDDQALFIGTDLHKLCWSLKQSIQHGFPDGLGRLFIAHLLDAAVHLCTKALHMKGMKENIVPFVYNIGGGSLLNPQNIAIGVKEVSDSAIVLKGLEEREILLRDPKEWEYSDSWYYDQIVPDVILDINREDNFGTVGFMVAEAKDATISLKEAETEAYLSALKGLVYGRQTAALITHPEEIWFISLTLENGRIVRRRKEYMVYQRSDGTANHTQYQELFQDIVLYLWNTYYMPS